MDYALGFVVPTSKQALQSLNIEGSCPHAMWMWRKRFGIGVFDKKVTALSFHPQINDGRVQIGKCP